MTRHLSFRPQATRPSTSTLFARVSLIFSLALAGTLAFGPAPSFAQKDPLERAQTLIDQDLAAEALAVIDRDVRDKANPRALFLRGTARIMLGEIKTGAADLEKAVSLDPQLRQAWLNLAGLKIAQGQFEAAHGLLVKARDLDPNARDNHLNLGAVLMMMGRKDDAQKELMAYLTPQSSAEDYYLVAANLALGGLQQMAVLNLREAFTRNERLRLRARTDDRFALLDSLEYKVLLSTDTYKPPAGYHQAAAAFKTAYQQDDDRMMSAVLSSLRRLGIQYEPEIEANARWAVIQGDYRIKLYNQENGTGVVSLSAPPTGLSAAQWQQRSQELFRTILETLGE